MCGVAGLHDACVTHSLLHRPLKRLVADVMATHDAALRGSRGRAVGGKTYCQRPLAVLPTGYLRASACGGGTRGRIPCARSALHGACARHATVAAAVLSGFRAASVTPILAAFAVAYDDGAALELDILDSQTHRLEDAHACAVEKAADQAVRSMQATQHGGHFLARQDDGAVE